jgi:O-methyltransferase
MSMLLAERYLSLLKKALCNELYVEAEARIVYLLDRIVNNASVDIKLISQSSGLRNLADAISSEKERGRTIHIVSKTPSGEDQVWHSLRGAVEVAHTMVGRKRLDNLHFCLDAVRRDNVPGDLIETGVWRGGSTIFMRGYLEAFNVKDRTVWVADSFEGLPESTLPQDRGVDLSARTVPFLAISLPEVQNLFSRYELLDDQVRFLKGWFRDTLHQAPISKLAVLRLDGDLYESTTDALTALYDKVSTGGFVIVDDYYTNPTCLAAVQDFWKQRRMTPDITRIDDDAVYWRKSAPTR